MITTYPGYFEIEKWIPMLEDNRLSLKAKGLMIILANDTNWVSPLTAEASAHDGSFARRKGVKELLKAGYLTKNLVRGVEGKYTGTSWGINPNPTVK